MREQQSGSGYLWKDLIELNSAPTQLHDAHLHLIMDLDVVTSDDDRFGESQCPFSQESACPAPKLRSVSAVPNMPAASASSGSSSHCGSSHMAHSSY
ncbi:hypothetical protein AOLI_G00039590 [Acnodon oligacanthus]